MKTYLDLLYLSLIVVFIVDISGISDIIISVVSAYTRRKWTSVRPFTCSLCMVWWCGLAALLMWGCFDLPHIAFVALLAFLSNVITDTLHLLKDTLIKILNRLNRWN